MKKIITLGVFMLATLCTWAQDIELDTDKGNVSFGIKTGWLQSTIKGDDLKILAVDGKVTKTNSFFAGVSVYTGIGEHFGFKHELFYQQYGADFQREIEDIVLDATLEMHSLRLNPLSPTFKIGGLQVYAGPYVNMLLYSSITAVDEDGNTFKDRNIFGTEEEDTEEYKYLQKMDYGFVAGIEYQFNFGLSVGAHYSRGFATLFDNANTHGLENNAGMKDYKIYNESFGISLGYHF